MSFEVETVLGHKYKQDGSIDYLLKWNGYPNSENNWVAEDDCSCPLKIEEYWRERERVPTPPTSSPVPSSGGGKINQIAERLAFQNGVKVEGNFSRGHFDCATGDEGGNAAVVNDGGIDGHHRPAGPAIDAPDNGPVQTPRKGQPKAVKSEYIPKPSKRGRKCEIQPSGPAIDAPNNGPVQTLRKGRPKAVKCEYIPKPTKRGRKCAVQPVGPVIDTPDKGPIQTLRKGQSKAGKGEFISKQTKRERKCAARPAGPAIDAHDNGTIQTLRKGQSKAVKGELIPKQRKRSGTAVGKQCGKKNAPVQVFNERNESATEQNSYKCPIITAMENVQFVIYDDIMADPTIYVKQSNWMPKANK